MEEVEEEEVEGPGHLGHVRVYAAFCLALCNAFKHKRRQSASALQMKRVKTNQIENTAKHGALRRTNPKGNTPLGTPAACA
jgi:hypothetical protein